MKNFFFREHLRLCPSSLALASSIPVLGLESVCPRKGCPWPWPFLGSLNLVWPRALCPRFHLWYLLLAFIKKMFRLVLCEVSVACNFLKTMTTDKLYQRIYLDVNLQAEFNLARLQTTLFVEFCFRKIWNTYDKTRLY